jgi:hypothetical protein
MSELNDNSVERMLRSRDIRRTIVGKKKEFS